MKITNQLGLPQPMVQAVSEQRPIVSKQYSVTTILKGVCQVLLERRHDTEIEQDVSDMIWLIFGTAVHGILENAQETNCQLKENKIGFDLPNGYRLFGTFDLYDDSTGTVTDYKTASVNKVLFADWDDYRKQTLIYCWLLRKIGFNAHRGEIVAILKDQSKAKALQGGNYPQKPIYKISWDFTEEDFVGIEDFILNRFDHFKVYEQLPDSELPICTPSERWHKDDTYAVMKEGRKSAIRVLNTRGDAQAYIDNNMLDKKHSIVKREGADNRCDNYCNVNKWCPYYQSKHDGNCKDCNAETVE